MLFDLHSPWHENGRNDKVFISRNPQTEREKFLKFSELFENEMTPGAFKYHKENDIEVNEDWNTMKEPVGCGRYAGTLPCVDIGFTLETSYFGEKGNVVKPERLIETGRCFLRVVIKYLS